MDCRCGKKAVYDGLGQKICKDHFLSYFEDKVFWTIRKYKLIEQGDTICVAASGGKDSLNVLYLTMKFCREHNVPFFALAIDEGIEGYRDHTLDDLRLFCDQKKIQLHVASFKQKYGMTLDAVRDKAMKEFNKKPCTVCGILRRTSLNRTARELGATKLVTGHNLDDESQSLLMNVVKGNMGHNAGLGPITGLHDNEKFVPRVKPLYFVSEKETRLYCILRGFHVNFNECPNIHLSFRATVRDELNLLEQKYPGAKQGIVNAFLEIIRDLKEKYRNRKSFSYCERCGDPCASKICNACTLEEELCLKSE